MALRKITKALFVVLVFATSAGGCKRGNSITVAGSTAFLSFAEKLADQYMEAHPEASINVQGGGSAVGIQAALYGTAQIGMADLVELPAEAAGLKRYVVAKDGISLIVNPKNRVTGLTMSQIREILNGTITNWRTMGGENRPITVISREAGSGTRSSLESIIGGIRLSKEAIIQDSNGTVRETVANDVNAVGYISHGLVNGKVKALSVDGVPSSTAEIMKNRYKLVRPVFFLLKDEPTGHVKGFLEFVLSKEGQEIISRGGLIAVDANVRQEHP